MIQCVKSENIQYSWGVFKPQIRNRVAMQVSVFKAARKAKTNA